MAKTIKIAKFPSKNPFSRHLDPMRPPPTPKPTDDPGHPFPWPPPTPPDIDFSVWHDVGLSQSANQSGFEFNGNWMHFCIDSDTCFTLQLRKPPYDTTYHYEIIVKYEHSSWILWPGWSLRFWDEAARTTDMAYLLYMSLPGHHELAFNSPHPNITRVQFKKGPW